MKQNNSIRQYVFFLVLLLFFSGSYASSDNKTVQHLLSQSVAPQGVVFEIATSEKAALQWAIPRIQQYTTSLREKFPGLEIAIVSHGREQFVLQEKNSKEYEKVHKAVKELSAKGDVPVHICQTFAAWNNVTPEEFPDYIAVSTTGPQQVRDYVELGYTLIKLRKK